MASPHPRSAETFEVDDAAAAFGKFEAFTRKILSVPKKAIDRTLAKAKKKKRGGPSA